MYSTIHAHAKVIEDEKETRERRREEARIDPELS